MTGTVSSTYSSSASTLSYVTAEVVLRVCKWKYDETILSFVTEIWTILWSWKEPHEADSSAVKSLAYRITFMYDVEGVPEMGAQTYLVTQDIAVFRNS